MDDKERARIHKILSLPECNCRNMLGGKCARCTTLASDERREKENKIRNAALEEAAKALDVLRREAFDGLNPAEGSAYGTAMIAIRAMKEGDK
jgi:hypothetical protein